LACGRLGRGGLRGDHSGDDVADGCGRRRGQHHDDDQRPDGQPDHRHTVENSRGERDHDCDRQHYAPVQWIRDITPVIVKILVVLTVPTRIIPR
jgi:hypothetical protein